MLYTPLTKKAMKFCFAAHEGQLDKSGIPYVHHPLHVAESMRTEDETCVALLHDVMEDCGVSEGELRGLGLSDQAVEALRMLTHDPAVPYLDYVRAMRDARDGADPEQAAAGAIACAVKRADLEHNSQLSRLDEVTDADLRRVAKYREAMAVLDGASEE